MSLGRPPVSVAVPVSVHTLRTTKRPNLKQVLSTTVGNKFDGIPSVIDVKGVFVSTFPNQWTVVTNDEFKKLELSPTDPSRFPSAYEQNPYYANVFASPHSTYRFFVERDMRDMRWSVLARPPTDLKLYAQGEPGWECDRS